MGPQAHVLDVATGTAAVAIEITRRHGCRVTGVDQSAAMLEQGRRRVAAAGLGHRIDLVQGEAEHLPFSDAGFDGLTFTYLLRYVDDPAATLRELVRVVRPGGVVASLEFGVPPSPPLRAAWRLYTGVGLPALGGLVSPAWLEAGRVLRDTIPDFHDRWPLARLLEAYRAAGLRDLRLRRLSFGAAVVIWGTRIDSMARGGGALRSPAGRGVRAA